MKSWQCMALLVALTVAVFGQTVTFEFIQFDDDLYVTVNDYVLQGLTMDGARYAFSPDAAPITNPLALLTHMLDVELFGPNPGGHHGTNVLLHLLATLLLFVFCDRAGGSRGAALFVAAIFAVHPLHVESVAWVSSRKDPLSAVFFFSALLGYQRYVAAPSAIRMGVVALCFVLSLLAKPTTITFPFVLLLLDRWPYDRDGARLESFRQSFALIAEKIPLFLLTVLGSVATWYMQSQGRAVRTLGEIDLADRLLNVVAAYGVYVVQFVYPVELGVHYPFPTSGVPTGAVVLGAIILVGGSVAALATLRRMPWNFVGWFWFVGMLVPVIGIVQVGSQAHADRYMYLPSVGLSFAIAYTVRHLTATDSTPGRASFNSIAAVAIIAILTALGVRQTQRWSDTETLFLHTLSVNGNHVFLKPNLAIYYTNQGRYAEAEKFFQASITEDPENVAHVFNAAWLQRTQGNLDEAERLLRLAIEYEPDYADAHASLAAVFHLKGDHAGAVQAADTALDLDPANAEALLNRGFALENLGDIDRALNDLRAARTIKAGSASYYMNYGNALGRAGRLLEAVAEYRRALALNPDHTQVLYNLGVAYERLGNRDKALEAYRRAVSIQPDLTGVQEQIDRLEAQP